MESWRSPAVPLVEGDGVGLRLFDTATERVRPVTPGPEATLYVCGITPYDATHLGHAFTYLTFDIVQRVWLDNGHGVHYVQNVTDIDDPLLERAVALGEDWEAIARRETQLFRTDMEALGMLAPRHYIGAVESIPRIAALILDLQTAGIVYRVDDDWYFDISQASRFGQVSHWPLARMLETFGERGGDPLRPGKRHPLDPLMWLSARPDEPAWDTVIGHGRPGWHIECVAIALDHLGMGFDIQGGGSDLIFPHHEMGAAHAESITDSWPYARHYVHVGMVGYQGHKMSKSRGNLVFVSRLRADGVEPDAIRVALLAHHYRGDWEWTDEQITTAQARLAQWRAAVDSGCTRGADDLVRALRRALADDLDTPAALSSIDAWARSSIARRPGPGGDADLGARAIEALLGVRLSTSGT